MFMSALKLSRQASVELSRIQEELLREKHNNELRLKNLMLDIEQRADKEVQAQRVFAEKERSLRVIIQAYEGQKSATEIGNLKG